MNYSYCVKCKKYWFVTVEKWEFGGESHVKIHIKHEITEKQFQSRKNPQLYTVKCDACKLEEQKEEEYKRDPNFKKYLEKTHI